MTTDITIIFKDREVLLELDAEKEEPMTRHSPGYPASFEIVKAGYKDGSILSPDEIDFIDQNESDQIWDKLYELDEGSYEDYLLEKHEDRAREDKEERWP